MTDKQESILAAALELFANDGYDADDEETSLSLQERRSGRRDENAQTLKRMKNEETVAEKLWKRFMNVLFPHSRIVASLGTRSSGNREKSTNIYFCLNVLYTYVISSVRLFFCMPMLFLLYAYVISSVCLCYSVISSEHLCYFL